MENNNGGGLFALLGIIFLIFMTTGGLHKCQNADDQKQSAKEYCKTHDCLEFNR